MENRENLLIVRARDAYARRDWADSLDLLRQADAIASLAIEDLERLMWSAAMLDLDPDLFTVCERLLNAHLDAGSDDRAAYWAFFYGFRLFALKEMGRASAWMQRARRLVEHLGRECAVMGYLLLPSIHKVQSAGDNEAAARLAAEAVAIGERCSDIDLVSFARCLLGRALIREGRTDEGIASLDEAMLPAAGGKLSPIITGLVYCSLISTCREVYAFDRSREWTDALSKWCGGQPQMVQFSGLCLVHRAEIMELNGSWQECVAEARRAGTSLARVIADETAAGAAYQEAEIHRLRGEFVVAEENYRTASRLGLEPQPGLALLRLAQGRGDQAAASIRRVLAATAQPLGRARLLPAFVHIMIETGAVEDAAEACRALEAIAGRFATDILAAMAIQARGEVDLAEARPADALGHFRTATAVWRKAGAPYIEARLRVLAGQACRMLGDQDGADLEFDAACATFTALGAAPDLARVASLRPLVMSQKGLTRREIEVLGLIAAGKTNRLIATELGLSEKTVDRHVSNIFDKLAVSSRAGATAFAFQSGLL